jgi:hypothetical protein
MRILLIIAALVVLVVSSRLPAQVTQDNLRVIKAHNKIADYRIGHRFFQERWRISPQTSPDVLIIRHDSDSINVAFYTDRDSINRTLSRRDSVQFFVLLEDGSYALTELRSVPYEVYKPSKTITAFHDKGQLVEKPISVDFVSDIGSIRHKYINSLTAWKLDSVVFLNDNPDRQQLIGSPIPLEFVHRGDSLLLKPRSPESYAIFIAYHTIRALTYFDSLFAGYLDFESQTGFDDIKIFFGRYANSSPKEYGFPPGANVSPTLVYHEIGHRAFWLLKDTLRIGEVGDWLHMGLLEYFTVSLADYPVVLEGLVPRSITRDVSADLKYPAAILSYADSWSQYYEAYADSFSAAPMYKQLYDINLRRMASWDSVSKMSDFARKHVIEAHKSGLVITHPLWELRSQLGSRKCDQLVKRAMLSLPLLLPKRSEYLSTGVNAPSDTAQWYDFIYALQVADQELYKGVDLGMIDKAFNQVGFDLRAYIK